MSAAKSGSEKKSVRHYILDANAVLRYLDPEAPGGNEKITALFLEAKAGAVHIGLSVVNLGEVIYTLLKSEPESRVFQIIRELRQVISIAEADIARTTHAALLKYRYKMGCADSFAAALAIEYSATLVSADPVFEKLGRQLKWMKLPRFRE
jgi:predicted nucleic acid-binding protein